MKRHFLYPVIFLFLLPLISLASADTLTIAAVGDIMIGTSFPDSSYLPKKPENLFSHVSSYLQSADLAVGNLEGCMIDSGGTPKECWGKSDRCFIFRMPEKYTTHLVNAGFDAFGLANNHVRDMGPDSYRRTMSVLENAGLRFAGIYFAPADTFQLNGIKYGLASFSPHWATARMYNRSLVDSVVADLDRQCDMVIVMFHAGGEGPEYDHVTREREIYKGSNRGNSYAFAHQAIDAGADLVLGSGPHVSRGMELYKNRLIAYSLGNFCTYLRFNLSGSRGRAPLLLVDTDKNGEFLQGRIIPIRQYYPGYPAIDKEKKVIKEIQLLTKQDFPEMDSVLVISDNGLISKP